MKDLVSVRTAQAIRSKKIVICLNGPAYPFEKEMSSLRTTQAIRSRKTAIRSNGSSYPFRTIDLFTVYDAILAGGQTQLKLQWMFGTLAHLEPL